MDTLDRAQQLIDQIRHLRVIKKLELKTDIKKENVLVSISILCQQAPLHTELEKELREEAHTMMKQLLDAVPPQS